MQAILDLFSHLDTHLDNAAEEWGAWTYAVVFLIIFAETGLVVMPWLPGDSLLFAVGAICARGILQLPTVIAVLWVAAVVGNYTNFLIGRALSLRAGGGVPSIEAAGASITKLFGGRFGKVVQPHHLRRADQFFRKYGALAVLVSRFLPFMRTLVPFVAGISDMKTGRFLFYSAVGGLAWVGVCCTIGYYFFNLPWVKDNFALVITGLFAAGFVPIVIGYVRKKVWGGVRQEPTPPQESFVEYKQRGPGESQEREVRKEVH